MPTASGLYMLDILDTFVNNFGILAAGLTSIVVITYGVRALPILREHLNSVSSFKVGWIWMILLAGVTPLILGYSLISTLVKTIAEPHGGYPADLLGIFGWGMVVLLIVGSIVISFLPWSHKSRAAEEPPAPPVIGGKLAHTHVDDAALKAHAKHRVRRHNERCSYRYDDRGNPHYLGRSGVRAAESVQAPRNRYRRL